MIGELNKQYLGAVYIACLKLPVDNSVLVKIEINNDMNEGFYCTEK